MNDGGGENRGHQKKEEKRNDDYALLEVNSIDFLRNQLIKFLKNATISLSLMLLEKKRRKIGEGKIYKISLRKS